MASSYEKVIKKVIDSFSEGISPLKAVVQNQEIIIIQNKKMIELLDSINCKLESQPSKPE